MKFRKSLEKYVTSNIGEGNILLNLNYKILHGTFII